MPVLDFANHPTLRDTQLCPTHAHALELLLKTIRPGQPSASET
jgi:hypothetical protein